ncbi:MAG: hypothetical protein HRU32_11610 [Rhodobacteraceae bacterium]|nr:hypothetical protein [Paracoccaceae bacterium]
MRAALGITLAVLTQAATPVVGLTMGEVGREAVEIVSTQCGDAFARHMQYWPTESVERDVVWRNQAILGSEQEFTSENPALLDHLPVLQAWRMSGFGLLDDIVVVGAIATRDGAATDAWRDGLGPLIESLDASVDIYDCARPDESAFESAIADGASEQLYQTAAYLDCVSGVGAQMADAYQSTTDARGLQVALLPLVAEIDICEGQAAK